VLGGRDVVRLLFIFFVNAKSGRSLVLGGGGTLFWAASGRTIFEGVDGCDVDSTQAFNFRESNIHFK